MLPGMGGLNPAKMKQMMKQMGINQEEIEAERVIIESKGKRIIIEPAQVTKITMQGQESWQIAGESREESLEEGIKEEDVQLVMEKTGKKESEVRKVLEEVEGDMAEAIVRLSE